MSFQSNFSIRSILGEETGSAGGRGAEAPMQDHRAEAPMQDRGAEAPRQNRDGEPPKQDRPKYSYAAMIMKAIRSSKNGRLTLAEIYEFIRENYEYYKTCEVDWQSAVRQNLSLSEYFTRTPRENDDPGRGGYWSLSPEGERLVVGDDTGRLRERPIPPMVYQYGHCNVTGWTCYGEMVFVSEIPPYFSKM